ncbi:uncharacterized protein LOC123950430 [Meles meles]|uniref:uncharacterized protein LOC123950430 n=1 Tax=Meles meles TaxID=9662 RepID=UPI001E69D7E8|nr:uncharacterized protein LOC123950430 [Meles meles]
MLWFDRGASKVVTALHAGRRSLRRADAQSSGDGTRQGVFHCMNTGKRRNCTHFRGIEGSLGHSRFPEKAAEKTSISLLKSFFQPSLWLEPFLVFNQRRPIGLGFPDDVVAWRSVLTCSYLTDRAQKPESGTNWEIRARPELEHISPVPASPIPTLVLQGNTMLTAFLPRWPNVVPSASLIQECPSLRLYPAQNNLGIGPKEDS